MNFYPRKVVNQVEDYLYFPKKIIILLWPRQVGKTTILKHLYEKVTKPKFYFNLEKYSHCEKFATETDLLSFLSSQWLDISKELYLFVDEFQHCKSSEKIFKILYDEYPNIKVIATGSLSMEIKHKIQESLAWRKKIFYIYSLDLEEFIAWKKLVNWEKVENPWALHWFLDLSGNIDIFVKEYVNWLKEYMIWWGYPEVVLSSAEQEKKEILESIFDLYLKKDIINFLQIRHIDCFKKILTYLAVNSWGQLVYDGLANFAWCSIHTVKDYLEVLEQSFLVKRLAPFHTNKNIEIKKQPKVYFLDNGVRNWFVNNFAQPELRQDAGQLFEVVFYQVLIKNWFKSDFIKYWRSKDNRYEVDFVLEKDWKIDLFEVKFKQKIKQSDWKGIKKFAELYPKLVNRWLVIAMVREQEKKVYHMLDVYDLVGV